MESESIVGIVLGILAILLLAIIVYMGIKSSRPKTNYSSLVFEHNEYVDSGAPVYFNEDLYEGNKIIQ